MARLYVKEIALLLVGWIAFVQIRNWFRWRAVKKWGAQRGCGDLPAVKNKLPGGLERYSILFTGLKSILPSCDLSFEFIQWHWGVIVLIYRKVPD
jgi:hypothetical protein